MAKGDIVMASDNEAYFNAVKNDFVGSCSDSREFNELEYTRWLERFRQNADDSTPTTD
jgi:hypothetical protein